MKINLSLYDPVILVYFAFFILINNFIVFTAFDWNYASESGSYKTFLRVIAALLLIAFIFIKGELKKYYFLLAFIFLSFFILNNNILVINVLYLILFAACLSYVEIEKVLIVFFVIYVFIFFLHNILFFFGVLENQITDISGRVRYAFGFNNVNRLGMFYFYLFLISMYMLFRKGVFRVSGFLYIFLIVVSFIYIDLSGSRTALICLLIASIFFLFGRFNLLVKSSRFFLNFLFLICAFLSLWMATSYALPYNDFFSLRPVFFNYFFNELLSSDFNIIFGMKVADDMLVDNSYLLFFSALGLFAASVFTVLSPLFVYHSYIDKKYFPFIYSTLVYGVFESNIIRMELLIPILVVFILFFNRKNIN